MGEETVPPPLVENNPLSAATRLSVAVSSAGKVSSKPYYISCKPILQLMYTEKYKPEDKTKSKDGHL